MTNQEARQRHMPRHHARPGRGSGPARNPRQCRAVPALRADRDPGHGRHRGPADRSHPAARSSPQPRGWNQLTGSPRSKPLSTRPRRGKPTPSRTCATKCPTTGRGWRVMYRDPYRRYRRQARRSWRGRRDPFPVMFYRPGGTARAHHGGRPGPLGLPAPLGIPAVRHHGRRIRRRRPWPIRSTRRLWLAVALLTAVVTILAAIPHRLAWASPAARITAGIITRMWEACGIDRPAERAYAATVIAVTGGWLSAAIAIGPAVKPLPAIAGISTVILGIPWWAHRRRRARVRAERTLSAWPELAENIGPARLDDRLARGGRVGMDRTRHAPERDHRGPGHQPIARHRIGARIAARQRPRHPRFRPRGPVHPAGYRNRPARPADPLARPRRPPRLPSRSASDCSRMAARSGC